MRRVMSWQARMFHERHGMGRDVARINAEMRREIDAYETDFDDVEVRGGTCMLVAHATSGDRYMSREASATCDIDACFPPHLNACPSHSVSSLTRLCVGSSLLLLSSSSCSCRIMHMPRM